MFAQHWWLDAVCPGWSAAIAQKGDQVTGIWPYAPQQRMGISLLRNAKLTPYMGPVVFYPADMKEANRDSHEHDVIADLAGQLPATKVWHVSLHPGNRQAGLYRAKGLRNEVQQTFLIDLAGDEASLFANFKESLRRNIRAAEKEFTISDDVSCLPQLYSYQQQTLSNKGVGQPYTLADVQRLMDACKAHNSAALWVARKGSEVAAIVWNVWDQERSYYYMGAQKPGGDSYRAMSALLWHAIKQAKARGNTIFDLEGSMDPGVERFFRGFGGRRELYIVLKKSDSLLWNAINYLR
ncbi:MAG: GNAT family N-acetyltransferase [Sphingobacteriales bacterium]|nr:MAG: GNAT family N-acetyltransferase [Sphingobacteriales bacterium]